MELTKLKNETLELFGVKSVSDLSCALMKACLENDTDLFFKFERIVQDLSVDWLQMIFQYYEADRKGKGQDYTPISLANFVARLSGDTDTVIDLCAGSGALTIQKWNLDRSTRFELYEIDENVIPYLTFNMALRNIESFIYHSDVLADEVYAKYRIDKGEVYGKVTKVDV